MSLEGLLIHTLTVYRRSGRTDRFGQAVDQNPRQHNSDEDVIGTFPCRAWMSAGGLKMEERMVDTFERQYTVYTSLPIDLEDIDSVSAVDNEGRAIFGRSKIKDTEIKYNSGGQHHVELTVWEQAGGNTL